MSLRRILLEYTDEFYEYLEDYDARIAESEIIGDHEIALIEDDRGRTFAGSKYQLLIQRQQRNALNPEEQLGKFIPDNINFSDLPKILSLVKEWIDEYGVILAGSYDTDKTEIYKRILNRFDIEFETHQFEGKDVLVLKQ